MKHRNPFCQFTSSYCLLNLIFVTLDDKVGANPTTVMAHQQMMAEINDFTGEASDEVGESMVRSEPATWQWSEANHANSTPAHNFGQQLLQANASPTLPPLPAQASQYRSPYLDNLLRDHAGIIKPVDWSKVKKIRKWEYDP